MPQPTLSQLIRTCAADDLRAFLLDAMAEDDRLARKFRQRFEPHDGPDAAADLLRDIDELCEAYPAFISWRAAGSFESEYLDLVESYLAPARKARGLDRLLALCTASFTALTAIEIDDSDGFFSVAIGQVLDTLRKAVNWSSRAREGVFAWILAFDQEGVPRRPNCPRELHRDILSFEREGLEKLLLDVYGEDERRARDFIALADARIAAALKEAQQDRERDRERAKRFGSSTGLGRYGYQSYTIARWVQVRLHAMRLAGEDYQERLAYARDYLELKDVRQWLVDDAVARDDRDEAIRLLEEEQGDLTQITWALPQLADLYRETGRTADEETALQTMVSSGRLATVGHLARLRELTPAEAWPARRGDILAGLDTGNPWRCRILAEEGMVAELMDDIEARPNTTDLDEYRDLLFAHDPDRTLGIWHDLLMREARQMQSNRRDYERFGKSVAHAAKLPGGPALRDRVVSEVVALYPRRPALREVLARV